MTMLVVTDDMTFARQVANRIMSMDATIEVDEPAAFFASPQHERTCSSARSCVSNSVFPLRLHHLWGVMPALVAGVRVFHHGASAAELAGRDKASP